MTNQHCSEYTSVNSCPHSIRTWLEDHVSGKKEKLDTAISLNEIMVGRRSSIGVEKGVGGHLRTGYFQAFSNDNRDSITVYWNNGDKIQYSTFTLKQTELDIDDAMGYCS